MITLNQGDVLNRNEIKEKYGRLVMGGITINKNDGSILLTSNIKENVYTDEWKEDILYYCGDGQNTSQSIHKGRNKTLYQALKDGNTPVYLFEKYENYYYFQGQVKLNGEIKESDEVLRNGNTVHVIKFPLSLIDGKPKSHHEILSDLDARGLIHLQKRIIRYTKHRYIITDDDWKTHRIATLHDFPYVLEKNEDIAYKIKLSEEFGADKAQIIVTELEEIRRIMNDKKYNSLQLKKLTKVGTGYGNQFEIFAMAVLYNLDYDTVIKENIVHGSMDGKVDAVFIHDGDATLYQIKINKLEDMDVKDKMVSNFKEYLASGKIEDESAKDLQRFLKQHAHKFQNVKYINVKIIANNGIISPLQIYSKYLKQLFLPMTDNHLSLELNIPTLKIGGKLVNNMAIGDNVYIMIYKAKDFIEQLLYGTVGISSKRDLEKLFYGNVRGDLGVNEAMKSTILNEPEFFNLYNLGIDITGEVELFETKICIRNPTVNNGQQTLTNLYNAYKGNREALDKVEIKIIVKNIGVSETEANKRKIKSKIAKFTNTSKAIKPIEVLSLDDNIRDIQDQIYDACINNDRKSRFFLEINTKGKKGYEDNRKLLFPKNCIIALSDFLPLYLCDKNSLGSWNNNPSKKMNDEYISNSEKTNLEISAFSLPLSLKACKAIYDYKEFISTLPNSDKNDMKVGDLAFKFLLYYKDKTCEEAYDILKRLNDKYFYSLVGDDNKKSKLIDLYKVDSIYDKICDIMNSDGDD